MLRHYLTYARQDMRSKTRMTIRKAKVVFIHYFSHPIKLKRHSFSHVRNLEQLLAATFLVHIISCQNKLIEV